MSIHTSTEKLYRRENKSWKQKHRVDADNSIIWFYSVFVFFQSSLHRSSNALEPPDARVGPKRQHKVNYSPSRICRATTSMRGSWSHIFGMLLFCFVGHRRYQWINGTSYRSEILHCTTWIYEFWDHKNPKRIQWISCPTNMSNVDVVASLFQASRNFIVDRVTDAVFFGKRQIQRLLAEGRTIVLTITLKLVNQD